MKALILAAGRGDRLEHLTDDLPKALVKVCGKELIHYQLDFLNHPLVQEIAIVCGYQSPPLIHFMKSFAPEVSIFENKDFSKGSILSIKSALPFLDDDFLLMNVDHIYPKRLLDRVLNQTNGIIPPPVRGQNARFAVSTGGGITAACDFDRPLSTDDMKVKLDEKEKLKAIDKKLTQYDCGYIGLTYCPKSKTSQYRQAIERTLASKGPCVSVEMILGELAAKGETVSIANTSGVRWLEVDTLSDLKQAETTLLKEPRFLQ